MSACQLAVIPAAGLGTRMGAGIPKQYLKIGDRSVLEHSIARLLEFGCSHVVVAVATLDQAWRSLPISTDPRVVFVQGGESRGHSVLAALVHLEKDHRAESLVMIHDAVRPCVSLEELRSVCASAEQHHVGSVLASPITDTVKIASATSPEQVERTVDRARLWRALTPQVFRLVPLINALRGALSDSRVTDEASAMELAGLFPSLVEGRNSNIKITYPDDLTLARCIIDSQKMDSHKVASQKVDSQRIDAQGKVP